MSEPAERTALYRLYDAEDDLLYIGISRNPATRFKVHERYQPWRHHVACVDLTWHADYLSARADELARQRSERPPYNAMHSSQSRLSWDMPALKYDSDAEIDGTAKEIRDLLDRGAWQPGKRLAPYSVSRSLGLPVYLVAGAMGRLCAEGYLRSPCKTYEVVARPSHDPRR